MKRALKEGQAVTVDGETGQPHGQWRVGKYREPGKVVVQITYENGQTDGSLVEEERVKPLLGLA